MADTRARAGESLDRISTNVKPYSDKKYWTQAANELRRQLGTLRFDLDNLVAAKGAGATGARPEPPLAAPPPAPAPCAPSSLTPACCAEVDSLVKSLEKLDFAFRCVCVFGLGEGRRCGGHARRAHCGSSSHSGYPARWRRLKDPAKASAAYATVAANTAAVKSVVF